MKMINFKGLLAIIFFLILFYIIGYFFVKFKYSAIINADSFISSIIIKDQRINQVHFYSRDSFELSIYYIFLPMSKIEKTFNKDFYYEATTLQIIR